jgi:hypothetical protein
MTTSKKAVNSKWASVSFADDDSIVVSILDNDSIECLWFESREQFRQALDSKMLRVKKWATTVRWSDSILKPLTLPARDLREAVKMVQFELPSLVPIPAEHLVYGCIPLKSNEVTMDVLVCVFKNDDIASHLDVCESVGILPSRICLDTVAVHSQFQRESAYGSDTQLQVLCDGIRGTLLTSVDGRLCEMSQQRYGGLSSDERQQLLFSDILHRKQNTGTNGTEAKILLAGCADSVSRVRDELVSAHGQVAPGDIVCIPTPCIRSFTDFAPLENGRYCYEAFVASGAIPVEAGSGDHEFNLLPAAVRGKIERKSLVTNATLTLALAGLVLVAAWLCLIAANHRILRYSKYLDSQILPIKDLAGSVEAKRQIVEAMQYQLSDKGLVVAVLEELYKYTPNEISISELELARDSNKAVLRLRGRSDILSNAFGYTDALQEAKLLRRLNIEDAQQVPRPGGSSVVEFRAECVLGDME